MLCEKIEALIPEYLENQLSNGQQEEVEGHLAGCAGCRSFALQLQRLDASLSAHFKAPVLSAGFERQLRARLESAPALLPVEQRAARRRQLQAEFEAGRARIRPGLFALGHWLEHLTLPVLASAAACLVWGVAARLTAPMNTHSPAYLLPWLGASAVFVALGLAEAFPHKWKGAAH